MFTEESNKKIESFIKTIGDVVRSLDKDKEHTTYSLLFRVLRDDEILFNHLIVIHPRNQYLAKDFSTLFSINALRSDIAELNLKYKDEIKVNIVTVYNNLAIAHCAVDPLYTQLSVNESITMLNRLHELLDKE